MPVQGNPLHPGAPALAGARLPTRVRTALERLWDAASVELERRLEAMLLEFEQELLGFAEHARSPAIEAGYLQLLRTLRTHRAGLVPRFLRGVESTLAELDAAQAPVPSPGTPPAPAAPAELALVEEEHMDAELVLRDVAQRGAARASLSLHLLGQRFGVLAAAPAFDARRLPLGPWSLCTQLLQASAVLQLPREPQHLLLRVFERKVMADYEVLAELFNVVLAEAGVLPALSYVPLRLRPGSTAPAASHDAGAATPATEAPRATPAERPHAGWLAQAGGAAPGDRPDFQTLQALLAAQRAPGAGGPPPRTAPARAMGTAELILALGQVRATLAKQGAEAPDLHQVKREVLLRVRERHGHEAALAQEDSDIFDLLAMLYERIELEVRAGTEASALLRQLQMPVLHAALRDRSFFTEHQHPARQLLNTVAETGARWLDEHDADPLLRVPIQRAVDHVLRNAHHDPSAFETGNQLLQHELQLHARRSEMAERRHVEAARGREKLEVARRLAAETLSALLAPHAPPKFVRALFEQAWADVLTLALLRHGPDSAEWRQALETTQRIVAASCTGAAEPDPELAETAQAALVQVGYHAGEAAAIARRLASQEQPADGASRTELAAVLKSRARLGEGTERPTRKAEELPPRTPAEQAQYERVRQLPFGTWIEFVVNQQGDVARRRLSWYSTVTDRALFVNLRGQRVGEQTLDGLARTIARGQARVVTVEHARPVDRAWRATLGALRGLAGRMGTFAGARA